MTIETRDCTMTQAAEIEAALSEMLQVKEAAVLSCVRVSGDGRMVAHVVQKSPFDQHQARARQEER